MGNSLQDEAKQKAGHACDYRLILYHSSNFVAKLRLEQPPSFPAFSRNENITYNVELHKELNNKNDKQADDNDQ